MSSLDGEEEKSPWYLQLWDPSSDGRRPMRLTRQPGQEFPADSFDQIKDVFREA